VRNYLRPKPRNKYVRNLKRSRDSVVCIATRRPRGWSSNPGRVNNFHFFMSSRPTLGFAQPPTQYIPGDLSPGVKRQGVKLTTQLQLVPSSRERGSIHPLPHTPFWRNVLLIKHRDNFNLTFTKS
jgi:hypothetical protein